MTGLNNPLTPAGLLAPTYRNQLAFIDIFFRGMNNTNYNMAVCGTSGAGKTGLIQPLIRSVLDSGGFAVVFDMGDGYKSLCENMGGVYLDGETLRFNPFANITDIDQSAERVRDQLSVMASPNGNLDEVHEGLLLQAVRASWLAKKNRARIDDVVDFLKNARDNDQYVESPTIRSRLDEMIVLLDQYTANGTYGRYFNSDEPSLRDDARMVVLELGGLEDRPSLLVAVMFSLIIYIENRMYRTPRNLKKLNVIDEGWRLLDFKNHKVGEFIEKGYRTARRHTGAYITITQNIVDFDSDKASSAARAAWGNSSYKIILKQSAKEFAKYNQLWQSSRRADMSLIKSLLFTLLLAAAAVQASTRDEIERLWNPQGMAAQPAQPAAGTSARTEKPAPRWFRLSNGRQVNLADWKVVLFMQGHCPYCHQFDPVLKQLAQQYGFSVFPYTLDGQGDTAFPEALPVPPDVMQTFFPNIPVAGLVMTVLTVGLVSCAGKSLPRFWPGDFFPIFYACHLAVLGVLAP